MRVDDKPVVLLYGAIPAYRALFDTSSQPATSNDNSGGASEVEDTNGLDADSNGSLAGGTSQPPRQRTDSARTEPTPPPAPMTGGDVSQLEQNLALLGYTGFDVDEEFTANTAEAVKDWQRDVGSPVTGRVELGDVLFLPGPIRLITNDTTLGSQSPDSAVRQTSIAKVVTATAPSESLGWAEPGTRVKVTLPSQRVVPAVVDSVVTGSQGSDGSLQLSFIDPQRAPDAGAVTISYVTQQVKNAVTVPVTALVALAEGGYGVQLDDTPGTFVPVTPGLYADGRVEVQGALEPGIEIRVPR